MLNGKTAQSALQRLSYSLTAAHQERFGLQYLAQGHSDVQLRIWNSNLPVTERPLSVLMLTCYSSVPTCFICFLFTYFNIFFSFCLIFCTLTMFFLLLRTASVNSEDWLFLEIVFEFGTKRKPGLIHCKKKKLKNVELWKMCPGCHVAFDLWPPESVHVRTS